MFLTLSVCLGPVRRQGLQSQEMPAAGVARRQDFCPPRRRKATPPRGGVALASASRNCEELGKGRIPGHANPGRAPCLVHTHANVRYPDTVMSVEGHGARPAVPKIARPCQVDWTRGHALVAVASMGTRRGVISLSTPQPHAGARRQMLPTRRLPPGGRANVPADAHTWPEQQAVDSRAHTPPPVRPGTAVSRCMARRRHSSGAPRVRV